MEDESEDIGGGDMGVVDVEGGPKARLVMASSLKLRNERLWIFFERLELPRGRFGTIVPWRKERLVSLRTSKGDGQISLGSGLLAVSSFISSDSDGDDCSACSRTTRM